MPITPFHFGPGALLHAAAPRQLSFIAFCAANVFIDVESLVNLAQHRHPVHAFFHTLPGATLMIGVVLLVFLGARAFAARWWLPNVFGWQQLAPRAVLIGAALGAWSHVLLDGFMHADAEPLWPLLRGNPLHELVPLGMLHLGCVALGLLGLLLLGLRWLLGEGAGDQTSR